MMQNANIFISGINGFLGSEIAKQEVGKKIYGLINKHNHRVENINNIKKLYSSIIDIPKEIAESISIVYHCAAYIPWGNYDEENNLLEEVNLNLTLLICNTFVNAKIVYASSVSVYGEPIGLISLKHPFNNPSLYGQSKLDAESYIICKDRYHIIRFSSLIGKGMPTNSFIPIAIKDAKENKQINVYGKGKRVQNYIDIIDAAKLCILCGHTTEDGIINGISPVNVSNHYVVDEIIKHIPATINYLDKSEGSNFEYEIDYPTYVLENINFTPIEETIAKLCHE